MMSNRYSSGQLSIDETQAPSFHYEIGKRLAPLREESVLILGSGNIVHNLHAYAWGQHVPEPYEWAVSFEKRVRELLLVADDKPLIAYENQLGTQAELAVPTPDHYLPLLYVAGARARSERACAVGECCVSCRRGGWRIGFDACGAGGLNHAGTTRNCSRKF